MASFLTSLRISAPDYQRARNVLLRHSLAILLCLMSLLASLTIFEQGRTIDSQRNLIHQLFQDSLELNAAKMKLAQRR